MREEGHTAVLSRKFHFKKHSGGRLDENKVADSPLVAMMNYPYTEAQSVYC